MIKHTALTAAMMIAFAAPAAAQSINERNDMRASEERVAGKLKDVSAACGSGEISVNVDWAPLNGYDYDTAKKEKNQVIYTMGPVMGYYADHLRDLCRKDAAYKAAIGKISAVNFRPTAEFAPANYHSVVGSSVSGSTLTIRFRPYDQPSEIDLEKLENAF
jgi:hypothetical protein